MEITEIENPMYWPDETSYIEGELLQDVKNTPFIFNKEKGPAVFSRRMVFVFEFWRHGKGTKQ